ncbi:hypothetical protein X805_05010 [Sphaerotilus natans subsp. natans DSM 6575]|uniref:Uncharacterized protein n=1 Tax=Sphaerotilus natans subsp. natans DSM 6575 TaxID=1286631 RepID=A0A059KR37_9BURK|nr:hypothetical protein [Sphaerotilus natans]KDB53947.1 hypothetical protein X805_05010 [Sphaerotilus natans subsp. natans DSM 6575]SIR67575.1 hypothetical protein SAMN05421778_11457 [Sphaerotilus natans]
MAIVSFRTSGLWADAGSGMQLVVPGIVTTSSITGTMQSRLTGLPYHELTLITPRRLSGITAGRWKALIDQLRGQVNHLEAYDPAHLVPNGTARGAGSSGAAAASATAVYVSGLTGTLLRGDRLQIGTGLGSHYLHVTADVTLPGTVSFEPPLRTAIASGQTVQLDRPSAMFKLVGQPPLWPAAPGQQVDQVTLKFREQWQ